MISLEETSQQGHRPASLSILSVSYRVTFAFDFIIVLWMMIKKARFDTGSQ
jgi:hypothetical protein